MYEKQTLPKKLKETKAWVKGHLIFFFNSKKPMTFYTISSR